MTASPAVPAADRTESDAQSMQDLLVELLRIPSVSGQENELTRRVADWGVANGFEVDLWQSQESDLARFPRPNNRHLPLAGRPTLVLRLPGTGGGRSLLFNAHADVVPAGDETAWTHGPWAGDIVDGRVFGRGACDVKGPLVSALWAMKVLQSAEHRTAGDVLLELIPGEEDCVGLGTLTSVARGWTADGCVVLEPTESEPRCASRGGLRFEIVVHGRSVHGTVKWLGHDAIIDGVAVLNALQTLEANFNDRAADPLFAAAPFARPVTVDRVRSGDWQGMVADRCQIGGYFELLPGDDVDSWKTTLESALRHAVGGAVCFDLSFPETYAGHRTDPLHAFCQAAEAKEWLAFNSGCEAGLRANLLGTPTLVWGPGSLAQAHAADEFVDLADVRRCADRFARFAAQWCGPDRSQEHWR